MKRLGQFVASLLFVLTVSTVYFAFDMAVTSMHKPKKYTIDRILHTSTTTSIVSLISVKEFENNQLTPNHTRRMFHPKRKQSHGKSAQFHKSRTGVKINAKNQRKPPSRTDNRLNAHPPRF